MPPSCSRKTRGGRPSPRARIPAPPRRRRSRGTRRTAMLLSSLLAPLVIVPLLVRSAPEVASS
eukprot:4845387-Pyramimonas_sp.AAC.1